MTTLTDDERRERLIANAHRLNGEAEALKAAGRFHDATEKAQQAAEIEYELSASRFDEALEAFKNAAARLDRVWTAEIDVADYPAYLPSFDEFAVEVSGIERVR